MSLRCSGPRGAGRRARLVRRQPAQQRRLAPSRRPLCRRAVGFDGRADGDPRSRHHGRPISRQPCRCSSSCAPSWRRATPAVPMPASPTTSRAATRLGARLDRADAEHAGAARRATLPARPFRRPGAAGARPDRLGAAAGRHRAAAAGARRRVPGGAAARRCRTLARRGRPVDGAAHHRPVPARTMSTCRPSSRR